ncbi:MAG: hypothetical protein JRE10_05265 [Deltaproteobacteria bacterium]|nr:hypothetical protein [Deltaproteobacteria bacterium]
MTCYLIFTTPLGHMAVVYRATPFAVIKILLPGHDKEDLVTAVETFGKLLAVTTPVFMTTPLG